MQYVLHSALLMAALALTQCSATSNKSDTVDCSQYQQSASIDAVQVRFTSILDNEVGPNGYLHAEVSFLGQGWIGFGYSANGQMVPGFSVIGLPGLPNSATNPGKYIMAQQYPGPGGVYLMDNSMQTLTNASVTTNATHTIMQFTKRLEETGVLTINGQGSNNFLVAYGDTTNVLTYHVYRNSFVIRLQPCVKGAVASASSSSSTSTMIMVVGTTLKKQLWTAHGVFAAVAWGVLAPIAIGASLLRKFFIQCGVPALWFKIHMIFNIAVFIFTIISFAFAVRATTLDGEPHFTGLRHRTTGLAIMILVFFQVMMGIFRPHRPNHPNDYNETESEDSAKEVHERDEEKDDEQPNKNDGKQEHPNKSFQRLVFEIVHRLLGFGLLGFTWWQVQDGLGLYSQYFTEKDLSNVFWGVAGGLSAITLALYLVTVFRW